MKRNSLSILADEMKEYRREMHKNPQTAYEETFASDLVASKLEEWGIPYERGFGVTGIVAKIEGQKSSSGRAIGLRADMDALEIEEDSGQPWTSQNPGKMHACGHDGHTSILLGTAKYLNETKNFDGTVHLIFQPAEEGARGAKAMMKDGLFEKYPCDEIYGLHNWPWLEIGKMAVRPGNFFAASDLLQMTIRGKGGHAAFPHNTVDPVIVATNIIQSLQTIISREVDPAEPAVISITNLHAGTGARNIIADTAEMTGSIRSCSPETREFIHKRIEEVARDVAKTHRGEITEIILDQIIDPTFNDPAVTNKALASARSVFGEQNCDDNHPLVMGGEDFGAFANESPGAYIVLGQRDPENDNSPHNHGLHSPHYDFNDDILPLGMEYFIEIIEQGLPLRK